MATTLSRWSHAHGRRQAWSPDGRTIIFQRDTADSGTPGPTKLMAVDAVTRAERVVYWLPSWAPGSSLAAFAPDGKRILSGFWCLYGDSCPASSRAERNATLATIQPDGRGLRLRESVGWTLCLTLSDRPAGWARRRPRGYVYCAGRCELHCMYWEPSGYGLFSPAAGAPGVS